MKNDEKSLEKIVLTKLVRLNGIVSGLVTGIIAGGGLFIVTNWLVLKGGETVGPHLALLSQFLYGYSVTFVGSFVGLTYGLAIGFFVGYTVALLYNLFLNLQEKLD
ncbi:MAG: hypothetical protein DWQ04_06720 [Chloroflexi bacterium]|nr:MAG: hypothetical protein DWQ04_06720 [Chloroflexota bacterium]